MDEQLDSLSSYLTSFRKQDEATAQSVLRAETPYRVVESFRESLREFLGPKFGIKTITSHSPELGPMGELPPESRRDVARALIQGRQPEVISRVSAVEQTHEVPNPEVPSLAFHVLNQASLRRMAF